MSEMITKNHAFVAEFCGSLDRLLDGIENFMANSRPTLGGERFLTDREVSARLKVSRRTLQNYRNNGVIAYYQLGGKILYKESDIDGCLPPIIGRRSDRLTEIPCKTVLPSNGVRDSLIRRLRSAQFPALFPRDGESEKKRLTGCLLFMVSLPMINRRKATLSLLLNLKETAMLSRPLNLKETAITISRL